MIPLIHVEKIHVTSSGTASLQVKLVSAVVTDICPINTRTRQTRTIDRLKKRKGLAGTVASQLAQLRMERQDQMDPGNRQPQPARLPGSNGAGSMHQIPSSGSSGLQGTQDNLNAYLGGAPAMNQSPPVQTASAQPVSNQPSLPSLPQAQLPAQQQVPEQQVQLPVGTQSHSGATHLAPQLQTMAPAAQPVQFGAGAQTVQGQQPVLQIQ